MSRRPVSSPSEPSAPQSERSWVLAIFAVAFVTRALFLFATSDRAWSHSLLYEGDAPVWARWAAMLDRGESFEFGVPMRTPGMAYGLHWLVPGVLGPPFIVVKLWMCGISAATCAWLFVAVRRELSLRTGLIAAGLTCFSFGQYQLATSLNNEAPYALLVVALVDLTLRLVQRVTLARAALVGALHGLAILLRAEHTLLLALLLAFTLWKLRARFVADGLRATACVGACAVVVCLPWSLHSHRGVARFNSVPLQPIDLSRADPPWTPEAREFFAGLPAFARGGNFEFLQDLSRRAGKREVALADVERFFDEQFGYVPEPLGTWTLSSTKGAFDFALANDLRSNGGFSRIGLYDGHDEHEKPMFAFGRPSHLELYNHGYAVGLARIRADFKGWLELVGKKLARFGDGATLGLTAFNLPHGRASVRRAVDLATPSTPSRTWQFAVVVAILAGCVIALRRRAGALWLVVIANKLAITVAFYGYARQAVSIAPAFYVLAAIAIDAALARFERPVWRTRTVGLVLVVVALALEFASFVSPPSFEVVPTSADATSVPAPTLGAGAFECFHDVLLVPRG